MGLRIGQSIETLSYTGALRQPPRSASLPGQEEAPVPRPTGRFENPSAGFGRNTLSPGVAALTTLDTNLQSARRVLPTLEEQLEEVRSRFDAIEQERAASAESAAPELEQLGPEEAFRPEASAQVSAFAQNAPPAPAPGPVQNTLPTLDVLV